MPLNSVMTDSSIQIETTVKNGRVFVSVKDHGSGISKDKYLQKSGIVSTKLMPPGEKTAKAQDLGLSIVKEIINAHNQNIDVISTEGVGTEFIFTSGES